MREESIDRWIHRYADGDLPEAEAAALRRQLEGDPALRGKLAALLELRRLVRAAVARGAGDVPSDDLWGRIEGRLQGGALEADRDGGRPPLRVVHGDVRPDASDASVRRVRRGPVAFAVTGVLALAAAAVLAVVRTDGSGSPSDRAASIAAREPATPATGPDAAEPSGLDVAELVQRTEVLEVDFGENSGAIFAVEGDRGERHAVVWLVDDEPKESLE